MVVSKATTDPASKRHTSEAKGSNPRLLHLWENLAMQYEQPQCTSAPRNGAYGNTHKVSLFISMYAHFAAARYLEPSTAIQDECLQ